MVPMLRCRISAKLATLAIILILCSSPSFALSQTDFKTAFVTYVHDYDKYIPRWGNVYEHGDKIQLYTGVKHINRGRAAAIDFVVIIKDPKGYVVGGKVIQKRITGYEDETYGVFSIDVEDSWIDGKYQLDVYAFDVLNFSSTYSSYRQLYNKMLYSGTYSPSVGTVSRENAPYVKKQLTFYVGHYTVSNQFIVFDARLEALQLPEGASNVLKVTVANKISKGGSVTLDVLVDGKSVGNKTVELSGYEVKEVGVEIPPLSTGTHTIQVNAGGATLSRTLPVVINPLIYDKPILIGDVMNGSVVYSANNYVLGSGGISEINDIDMGKALSNLKSSDYVNREDAEKMLTNIFAYLYKHYGKTSLRIALLQGSDARAEKLLPELLDIIKKDSEAPITYIGVKGYNELSDVNVAVYVGDNPKVSDLKYFFKSGGLLIIDNPFYWKDYRNELENSLSALGGWRNVKTPEELYYSFYDLRIDRGIRISITTEITLPPKLTYSGLNVNKFITTTGEPVKISFNVRNVGKTGKEVVKVLVNGETAYKEELTLKTGETKSISFQYIPDKEGSYKVEIPGTNLVKVFFVKAKAGQLAPTPTPTPIKQSRGGGIFVAGSAALLAALIIARMLLRE